MQRLPVPLLASSGVELEPAPWPQAGALLARATGLYVAAARTSIPLGLSAAQAKALSAPFRPRPGELGRAGSKPDPELVTALFIDWLLQGDDPQALAAAPASADEGGREPSVGPLGFYDDQVPLGLPRPPSALAPAGAVEQLGGLFCSDGDADLFRAVSALLRRPTA